MVYPLAPSKQDWVVLRSLRLSPDSPPPPLLSRPLSSVGSPLPADNFPGCAPWVWIFHHDLKWTGDAGFDAPASVYLSSTWHLRCGPEGCLIILLLKYLTKSPFHKFRSEFQTCTTVVNSSSMAQKMRIELEVQHTLWPVSSSHYGASTNAPSHAKHHETYQRRFSRWRQG